MSGATDHLPRLLALVPWLLSHPDSSVAEVAREFEVTEAQIRADVNLLWMCGLPGYGPGDLIDVEWRGDRVTLSNAETIERPLRITPDEALALIAALRALAGVPGIVSTAAIDRALAKLESAAGGVPAADKVVVAPVNAANPEVVTTITDAVAQSRRVHLRYWVPARDEATERDVDPIRLFTSDATAYLSGWCHAVEDLRTFRLDRVLEAKLLDDAIVVPDEIRARAFDTELFTPSAEDRLVTFSLDPAARWAADYYQCEVVEERGDGGLVVKLRSRDDAWARRLALGLAGVARLTDPPDLARQVRDAAIAALVAYGV
ncbi:MAG TPA: WYL domain-containing protein [Mycobacteriales bacterium]|jgi:proteasome accessory factor C|nr:WYL domain-containing protein [Mycobacteriales bacterium]